MPTCRRTAPSDYTFSYDKMLLMNGNTATYMQYSYARVRSIFAKGGFDAAAVRASGAKIILTQPAERALGLQLLRFDESLAAGRSRSHAALFDGLFVRRGQSVFRVL